MGMHYFVLLDIIKQICNKKKFHLYWLAMSEAWNEL
jgi:hypothetical protein